MTINTPEEYEKAKQELDDITEFPGWESSFVGYVCDLLEAKKLYEERVLNQPERTHWASGEL